MFRLWMPWAASNFYPRSPCGERQRAVAHVALCGYISIHALLAESDAQCLQALCHFLISIHALLAESDRKSFRARRYPANFYPRSPCGERHFIQMRAGPIFQFLSTLSLRRATTGREWLSICKRISIHALLAESDPLLMFWLFRLSRFLSTLSLRRATGKVKVVEPGFVFLSTLSLRRATNTQQRHLPEHPQFLSTLSLRRATRHWQTGQSRTRQFLSTLSLRRATSLERASSSISSFLSTLSLRRATWADTDYNLSDIDFYPRSPCGERPSSREKRKYPEQ